MIFLFLFSLTDDECNELDIVKIQTNYVENLMKK